MTEKSASDVLRELLDERGVEWRESVNVANCVFTIYESPTFGEVAAMDNDGTLYFHELNGIDVTPEQAIAATLGTEINGDTSDGYHGYEQAVVDAWKSIKEWNGEAIAATLGRQKAKAHPYGYEPDTGAFDVTRCECGCLNDISATYCNDCGGKIEIDMNAEKEIYHTPRHSVFAEKHDDGSLEFGGKRYVAATLGSGTCRNQWQWNSGFCCSECFYTVPFVDKFVSKAFRYCPNCGCKIRKAVKR